MDKLHIFMAKELGDHISSRESATRLFDRLLYLKNTSYLFDFSQVRFASRSFMDEFYNKFLSKDSIFFENSKVIHLSNTLEQILESVKGTQSCRKQRKVSKSIPTKCFASVDELNHFLGTLSL